MLAATVAVLLFGWACGGDRAPTESPAPAPVETAEVVTAAIDDDLAVYDAVLRCVGGLDEQRRREPPVLRFVISSETVVGPQVFDDLGELAVDPGSINPWLAARLPWLEPACLQDFARRNREPVALPALASVVEVELVDPDLLDRLEAWALESRGIEGLRWWAFWQRYPDSSGLIRLSRVGYDAGRRQALVYVERMSHGLQGAGWLVLLVRDERWWVHTAVEVWVS